MGTYLGGVSLLSPLHRPSGLSLEKVDYYFCKQFGPRSGRHEKVGLDLHLNSVRSDVDPLMMFPGEFFPK